MSVATEKSVRSLLGECLRKKRMTSGHASLVIEKALATGVQLYKYHCSYCQRWHVTKMAKHPTRL